MRTISTLALPYALALAGACGGADKDSDTMATTPLPVQTDTLSATECDSMVAHMTTIDGTVDRDVAMADCTAAGNRRQYDCVMRSTDSGSIASCNGRSMPSPSGTTAPTDPTTPSSTPANPSDSTQPSSPNGPVSPGGPTRPMGPTVPEDPTTPRDPTGPDIP